MKCCATWYKRCFGVARGHCYAQFKLEQVFRDCTDVLGHENNRSSSRGSAGISSPLTVAHMQERKKRGKRAGVRAWPRANASWQALLCILLSNVCTLENKLDCIRTPTDHSTGHQGLLCVCFYRNMAQWLSPGCGHSARWTGLASSWQRPNTLWQNPRWRIESLHQQGLVQ